MADVATEENAEGIEQGDTGDKPDDSLEVGAYIPILADILKCWIENNYQKEVLDESQGVIDALDKKQITASGVQKLSWILMEQDISQDVRDTLLKIVDKIHELGLLQEYYLELVLRCLGTNCSAAKLRFLAHLLGDNYKVLQSQTLVDWEPEEIKDILQSIGNNVIAISEKKNPDVEELVHESLIKILQNAMDPKSRNPTNDPDEPGNKWSGLLLEEYNLLIACLEKSKLSRVYGTLYEHLSQLRDWYAEIRMNKREDDYLNLSGQAGKLSHVITFGSARLAAEAVSHLKSILELSIERENCNPEKASMESKYEPIATQPCEDSEENDSITPQSLENKYVVNPQLALILEPIILASITILSEREKREFGQSLIDYVASTNIALPTCPDLKKALACKLVQLIKNDQINQESWNCINGSCLHLLKSTQTKGGDHECMNLICALLEFKHWSTAFNYLENSSHLLNWSSHRKNVWKMIETMLLSLEQQASSKDNHAETIAVVLGTLVHDWKMQSTTTGPMIEIVIRALYYNQNTIANDILCRVIAALTKRVIEWNSIDQRVAFNFLSGVRSCLLSVPYDPAKSWCDLVIENLKNALDLLKEKRWLIKGSNLIGALFKQMVKSVTLSGQKFNSFWESLFNILFNTITVIAETDHNAVNQFYYGLSKLAQFNDKVISGKSCEIIASPKISTQFLNQGQELMSVMWRWEHYQLLPLYDRHYYRLYGIVIKNLERLLQVVRWYQNDQMMSEVVSTVLVIVKKVEQTNEEAVHKYAKLLMICLSEVNPDKTDSSVYRDELSIVASIASKRPRDIIQYRAAIERFAEKDQSAIIALASIGSTHQHEAVKSVKCLMDVLKKEECSELHSTILKELQFLTEFQLGVIENTVGDLKMLRDLTKDETKNLYESTIKKIDKKRNDMPYIELKENKEESENNEVIMMEEMDKLEETRKTASPDPEATRENWQKLIADKLNQPSRRDWRLLAVILGFRAEEILGYMDQPNPALTVLENWNGDARTLYRIILNDLERYDCARQIPCVLPNSTIKPTRCQVVIINDVADVSITKKISYELTSAGYPCWCSQLNTSEENRMEDFKNAIGLVRIVLVLVSRNSIRSENVLEETLIAFKAAKIIIPIRLDNYNWPLDDVPLKLAFTDFSISLAANVSPLKDSLSERWRPGKEFQEIIHCVKHYAHFYPAHPTQIRKSMETEEQDHSGRKSSSRTGLIYIMYDWELQWRAKDIYFQLFRRRFPTWIDCSIESGSGPQQSYRTPRDLQLTGGRMSQRTMYPSTLSDKETLWQKKVELICKASILLDITMFEDDWQRSPLILRELALGQAHKVPVIKILCQERNLRAKKGSWQTHEIQGEHCERLGRFPVIRYPIGHEKTAVMKLERVLATYVCLPLQPGKVGSVGTSTNRWAPSDSSRPRLIISNSPGGRGVPATFLPPLQSKKLGSLPRENGMVRKEEQTLRLPPIIEKRHVDANT